MKRPPPPPLPKGDHKIFVRPRGGFNTASWSDIQILDGARSSIRADLPSALELLRKYPEQNIFVICTSNSERAEAYSKMLVINIAVDPCFSSTKASAFRTGWTIEERLFAASSTRRGEDICPTPNDKKCFTCGTIVSDNANHECTSHCAISGGGNKSGSKRCRQRFLPARKPRAPLLPTLDPTDEATFPAMEPSTSGNRSTRPRDRSAGASGELHSSRSHSRSRSRSGSRERGRSSSRGPDVTRKSSISATSKVQRTATKRKADEPLQSTTPVKYVTEQELENLETRMTTMVTNKIEQMSPSIMEVVYSLQLEVAAQLNLRVSIVESITQHLPFHTLLSQSPRSASPYRTSRSTLRDPIPNLTPSPLAPPKLQLLAPILVHRNSTAIPHDSVDDNIPQTLIELIPRNAKNNSTFILNVYSPPRNWRAKFLNILHRARLIAKRDRLLVVGDFNAAHASWGYARDAPKGTHLWEAAQQDGMTLLNDHQTPTSIGNSVCTDKSPDPAFTRNIPRADWQNKQDCLGSDHYLISICLQTTEYRRKTAPKQITDWDKFRQNRLSTAPTEIASLEEWSRALLTDVSDTTRAIQEEPMSLQERGTAYTNAEKNKNNRKLKLRITKLDREIEDYASTLTRQHWHKICDSLRGSLGNAKTGHLLDPNNTKTEQRKNLSQDYTGLPNADLDSPILESDVRAALHKIREHHKALYFPRSSSISPSSHSQTSHRPGLKSHSLYADDITLWADAVSEEELEGILQQGIAMVSGEVKTFGLACSPEKSEYMIVRPSGLRKNTTKPPPYRMELSLEGETLPARDNIRILGITFQSNGHNTEQIRRLELATQQTSRLIRRIANRHSGMGEADLLRLIRAFVISSVTYAAPYSAEASKIRVAWVALAMLLGTTVIHEHRGVRRHETTPQSGHPTSSHAERTAARCLHKSRFACQTTLTQPKLAACLKRPVVYQKREDKEQDVASSPPQPTLARALPAIPV
ncbi:hypothetical protein HPB47_026073 [Ixodes persulcatus]|uniref:Uncharacterized protein n=1 Tax=Ixodes persulcatus TaxID=34615 RepID=A0AC60PZT2_IXOPE|nr:hypothetical protein HPB47_026073 [Ixodes persulcatus]